MPTSDDTTAPALLRIEGPIATITLNRPAAFNSIDLSIAKKLEQLGAEVEGTDDIRVLVIEGEGRAFCAGGDLQTIGAAAAADTIAPVVGELLQHYHAFITVRRMPKIVLSSVHGSAAGAGMSLAFVADLCIAAEDARFTPAYAKLGVSPDGGGTVGMVGSVGPAAPCRYFSPKTVFPRRRPMNGVWSPGRSGGGIESRDAKIRRAAGAESAGRARRHQVADLPGCGYADQTAARCRGEGIIDAMHTDDFRVAVKKFTSKSK